MIYAATWLNRRIASIATLLLIAVIVFSGSFSGGSTTPDTIFAPPDTVLFCGNTYYVDTRSTGSGDGTSMDTTGTNAAWADIDEITGLVAGDFVLFHRGQVWRRTATWFIPLSGTANSLVTFGAYESGERPIISGAANSGEDGAVWTASGSGTNEYYLSLPTDQDPGYHESLRLFWETGFVEFPYPNSTIGSLTDSTWGFGDNDALGFDAIYVRCDAGSPGDVEIPQFRAGSPLVYLLDRSHVKFHNMTFQHTDTTTAKGIYAWSAESSVVDACTARWNQGAGIQANNSPGFQMINCESYGNHNNGFAMNGQTANPDSSDMINVVFTGNISRDNAQWLSASGGCGFNSFGVQGIFSHNTIYHNTRGGFRMDGTLADYPSGVGTDFSEITYNHVYENGDWDPPTPGHSAGGGGIFMEGCYSNFIAYNYVHGNESNGQITVEQIRADKNIIAYNIVADAPNFFDKTIASNWGSDSTYIYNNVVDNGGYAVYIREATDCVIKNNIFINSQSSGDDIRVDSVFVNLGGIVDNNFSRGDDGGTSFTIQNGPLVGGKTWTEWQALGYDLNGAYQVDPIFVNEGARDFHLDTGSPCIDTGTDVGLTEDYEGNTVPVDSVDVGAFEVQP